MSMFDKIFKKSAFEQKMDDTYENIVENNPVMKKVRSTMDGAERKITHSLEKELYGKAGVTHVRPGDDDALMREWDSMFDQIFERELNAYKVCPSCGEMVPAEKEHCPKCGRELSQVEAGVQVCPHCGAKNRLLDLNCASCGKRLELVFGADGDEE